MHHAALSLQLAHELAHELMLDPAFKLDDTGCWENAISINKVRETYHEAFWNFLADQFRLPRPCFARFFKVLEEIRGCLLDLGGRDLSSSVSSVIDMDLIRHRTDQGLLSWADASSLVY